VDALNGMPGVLSARWSGRHGDDPANNALLLGQLTDVPDERRGAEFVCALALAVPGAEPVVVHGRWRGRLLRAPAGSNGFGYDPLFVPVEGDGRTFAEMTAAEKHRVSHRGRAFRTLADGLKIVQALDPE
jgi:XTP/dITP diphosphohydrolase